MKKFLILILFTTAACNVRSQTLITDTAHCIYYGGSSQLSCTNSDSVRLDLNSDGQNDLILWRNNASGVSDFHIYSTSPNFNTLSSFMSSPGVSWYAVKFQPNTTYNISNYTFVNHCVFYKVFSTGMGSGTASAGWQPPAEGYFCTREINNSDTLLHLVKLSIVNGSCFQVNNGTLTSISQNSTKNVYINFSNSIFEFEVFEHTNRVELAIYDTDGSLIQIEKSSSKNSLDLSRLSRGMYLIRMNYNDKTKTYKVVKLD
jgi:hypothetical protein